MVSIENIRNGFGETIRRFFMTITYCVILAMVLSLVIHHSFQQGEGNNLSGVLSYVVSGIFVSFCIDLSRQVCGKKKVLVVATICHIAIILNAIFCSVNGHISDARIGDTVAFISLCVISPFIVPFLGMKDDMKFWHFLRKFFINAVLNGIVVAAVTFCSILLLSFVDELFEIKAYTINYDVLFWLWTVLFPTMILLRMPHISELDTELASDKFSLTILHIFSIVLIIYIVILYVYILKILFSWDLPKGMVAIPVAVMMGMLILVRCLSYGINTDRNKFDSTLHKFLPWLALPALVLMSIGIGRRVIEYGITPLRAYLILLNLWFYAICIYMYFRRRLMPIVISFVLLAFLSSFGPTSVWRLFT